jgi:hypothetical protein
MHHQGILISFIGLTPVQRTGFWGSICHSNLLFLLDLAPDLITDFNLMLLA